MAYLVFSIYSIYDEDRPNLPVITTLSAMAIIRSNEELLDAALAEINKLPTDQQLAQDPTGEVAYLLASQSQLQGTNDQAHVYTHALHADPASLKAQEAFIEATQLDATGDLNQADAKLASIHKLHRVPWKAYSLQ